MPDQSPQRIFEPMNGQYYGKMDAVAGTSFIASLLLHAQDIYTGLSILAVLLAITLYSVQIWKALKRKSD